MNRKVNHQPNLVPKKSTKGMPNIVGKEAPRIRRTTMKIIANQIQNIVAKESPRKIRRIIEMIANQKPKII